MSQALDLIMSKAENTPGVELRGTMYLAFVKESESVHGNPVDEYIPAVKDITLHLDEEVLCEFSDKELQDLDELTKEIIEVDRYRRYAYQIPYAYSPLYKRGESPEKPKPFALPLDILAEITRLEKERTACIIKNIMQKGNDSAALRNGYERFRLHDVYQERPCSFEEYVVIRQEFVAGDYCTCMSLADYYSWETSSLKRIDENGDLLPKVQEALKRALTAWEGKDIEQQNDSIISNFEVHPRHERYFIRFADKFRAKESS